MQYFVYVLVSEENYNYVGMSSNLERRIKEHNAGESKYTRKGNGWRLVYYEKLFNRGEAREREKYFKSHAGKEWLKRRNIIN